MITCMDQETTEVQHRMRCAWSAIARHRQELTSKSYLLRHRLHLFEAVVTPTIMHGVGTRTTTEEHEKMIRTTQRRMLRLIIQTKRKYKHKKDSGGKDIPDDEMSEDTYEWGQEDSTNDE